MEVRSNIKKNSKYFVNFKHLVTGKSLQYNFQSLASARLFGLGQLSKGKFISLINKTNTVLPL